MEGKDLTLIFNEAGSYPIRPKSRPSWFEQENIYLNKLYFLDFITTLKIPSSWLMTWSAINKTWSKFIKTGREWNNYLKISKGISFKKSICHQMFGSKNRDNILGNAIGYVCNWSKKTWKFEISLFQRRKASHYRSICFLIWISPIDDSKGRNT